MKELEHLLYERSRDLVACRDDVGRRFRDDGPAAMVELIETLLAQVDRPDRFPKGCEAGYEPEARTLRLRYQLPLLEDTVPDSVGTRYIKARKANEKILRRPAERHALYRRTLARTVLGALADLFDATPPALVSSAVVNGYLETTDPSTGRSADFTVISIKASRPSVDELDLPSPGLDPERCLLRMNARISREPHALVPVRPVVPWVDLSKHKVLNHSDLAERGRMNLLDLGDGEFEELVRELFEAMGFTAWRTTHSHDEGIDVYATAEQPITGMNCVIQAKRYKNLVKPDFVRSLHGSLTDKNAHKGFLVTTAWFGPQSVAYAERNRIDLISGRELRRYLREHLQFDSYIPLAKLPQGWHPEDIG